MELSFVGEKSEGWCLSDKIKTPVALTIGGLDPSGGAGVLADVRTFVAFRCFPAAVVTSITYQNTTRVFGVVHQDAAVVRGQLAPIVEDYQVDAMKTGMLATADIVRQVVSFCHRDDVPSAVVDPVMTATVGQKLIEDDVLDILKSELLPLAGLVTPNIPEAETLTGLRITNEREMKRAAEVIKTFGAKAVLIKGGHLPQISGHATDILLDQQGNFIEFREEFVSAGEFHGTGCTLSAAIVANLARGMELTEAIRIAKSYVTALIKGAPRLGHGAQPLFSS